MRTPRSKSRPKIADSGLKGSCALTFLRPTSAQIATIIRKIRAKISADAQYGMTVPRPRIAAATRAMMRKRPKTAATPKKAAPLPTAMPLVFSSCFAIWISSLIWLGPRDLKVLPASMMFATPDLIPLMPAKNPLGALGLVVVVMTTSP